MRTLGIAAAGGAAASKQCARTLAIVADRSMSASPTLLRAGCPADATEGGRIVYEAFRAIAHRHGFPPDFLSRDAAVGLLSHLFSRPDVHSVVAEREGRVIGSNFLWAGDPIAGVGPIT